MTIRKVTRGKGHSYLNTETGERVPGVTKILDNALPKKALINWSATTTAEYAVDNWAALGDLSVATRLKELNGARWKVKDEAANRGTQVHKLAERLVKGERVAIPAGLDGYVESYVKFLDEFDVQPVYVERTIWSPTHNYCGTFDLIADLLDPDDPEPDPELRRRVRWLLDVKTNRSGIFGETALQIAAYRFADLLVDDETEDTIVMPEVDRTGAVHVTPRGYELRPLVAGLAQHRTFLYAQQIARFADESHDLVGEPIISPQTSVYTLAVTDA